jgi:hypothetical protein
LKNFDESDIQFILENENKMRMIDIAKELKCSCNDVYVCYTALIRNGTFYRYMRGKFCDRLLSALKKVSNYSNLPKQSKEGLEKMSNEEINVLINLHIEELEKGIMPNKVQSKRLVKALKNLLGQNENMQ